MTAGELNLFNKRFVYDGPQGEKGKETPKPVVQDNPDDVARRRNVINSIADSVDHTATEAQRKAKQDILNAEVSDDQLKGLSDGDKAKVREAAKQAGGRMDEKIRANLQRWTKEKEEAAKKFGGSFMAWGKRLAGGAADKANSAAQDAKETVSGAARSGRDTFQTGVQQVREGAAKLEDAALLRARAAEQEARDEARRVQEKARSKASEFGEGIGGVMRRGKEELKGAKDAVVGAGTRVEQGARAGAARVEQGVREGAGKAKEGAEKRLADAKKQASALLDSAKNEYDAAKDELAKATGEAKVAAQKKFDQASAKYHEVKGTAEKTVSAGIDTLSSGADKALAYADHAKEVALGIGKQEVNWRLNVGKAVIGAGLLALDAGFGAARQGLDKARAEYTSAKAAAEKLTGEAKDKALAQLAKAEKGINEAALAIKTSYESAKKDVAGVLERAGKEVADLKVTFEKSVGEARSKAWEKYQIALAEYNGFKDKAGKAIDSGVAALVEEKDKVVAYAEVVKNRIVEATLANAEAVKDVAILVGKNEAAKGKLIVGVTVLAAYAAVELAQQGVSKARGALNNAIAAAEKLGGEAKKELAAQIADLQKGLGVLEASVKQGYENAKKGMSTLADNAGKKVDTLRGQFNSAKGDVKARVEVELQRAEAEYNDLRGKAGETYDAAKARYHQAEKVIVEAVERGDLIA